MLLPFAGKRGNAPFNAQRGRGEEHGAQNASQADEDDHQPDGRESDTVVEEEIEEEGEADAGEHLLQTVPQGLRALFEFL